MRYLEWAILTLAAIWAVSTNLHVRDYYKRSATPAIPANTFAMVQLLAVAGVLGLRITPFHLLWLFPLSYVLGFLATRFKLLAFLPWTYGYILALTIPAKRKGPKPSSTSTDFNCPHCDTAYHAHLGHAGKHIRCTGCGTIIEVSLQTGRG